MCNCPESDIPWLDVCIHQLLEPEEVRQATRPYRWAPPARPPVDENYTTLPGVGADKHIGGNNGQHADNWPAGYGPSY